VHRMTTGAAVFTSNTALRENGTFWSFPYVCPEPVLVKC
jgi:hypothetical protein